MTAGTDTQRLVELEEDNKRLRRLLNLQGAPGELRHQLRSTLALLRAVIRKSAESERDLPRYVAQLEDRLDAVTRVQAFVDQHGTVDLRTLLADELFHYGASEDGRLQLSGPDVALQPRVGRVLALAVHELAVNAVEHGALGADEGWIEVSWTVAAGPGTPLSISWTEFHPAPSNGPPRSGFGTEVLTRMLPYELKAETKLRFEATGLYCTIYLPLAERAVSD